MPRNPKLFIHNMPIEICTSVRVGLPFVATAYMELLIKGVLAAAQAHYPIIICHYVIMANHLHILAIVDDPQNVPRFMGYFKTELAHAINTLFGWKGQCLWEDGYDSPTILSAEKFLSRMKYLYLNPTKARCANSIEEYRGLSSFSAMERGFQSRPFKRIFRDSLFTLSHVPRTLTGQKMLAERLESLPGETNQLVIRPWAWLECYRESKGWRWEDVLRRFLLDLRTSELSIAHRASDPGPDPERIVLADPTRKFKSEKFGKRTVCLSDNVEQRLLFIEFYRALRDLALRAYQKFKAGAYPVTFPPGFFAPGGALFSNLVPSLVPL